MAELVQLHLESTIPELEQMERTGLYTHEEIKKIIKKRKALEYLLRRRTKTKEDYLKYIQYEIVILDLTALRRQRLKCKLKEKEIDHSIAKRINKLFKAVIARHQGDEKLWLTQIEFCKRMKWHHTISGLFTRMLQIHSRKPELWVTAAKWEFEENNAPENARQLLQRSLRIHRESRLLWTEYFRMELMYTDLVIKRREALGLEKEQDVDDDAVLKGKVASVVHEKATKAIPGADFAVSLLEICRQFEFTCDHIDQIFQDIQHRLPLDEVALDAIAKRPLITKREELKKAAERGIKKKTVIAEIDQKVCASYEDAVELVRSEKMWSYYIEFVVSRWKSAKKEEKKSKLLSYVFDLMERARRAQLLSVDLYLEWCKLLQSNGDKDLYCSVAHEAARKWPKVVSLWLQCLTAYILGGEHNLIPAVLKEAMESVPAKESFPVWLLGMRWVAFSNPSKLKAYFEKGIRIRDICVPVKELYLEVTAIREDVPAARELYKRLRYMFPVSPELYKKMIFIENAQLKPSIKWLRTYHEDAIREYGEYNIDFWVDLMQLEVNHPDGDVRNRPFYRDRAMRTLNEDLTENFVYRCTMLDTGHSLESLQ